MKPGFNDAWFGFAGEAMDIDEALSVLRTLLKGATAVDADAEAESAEGRYGHLLMDEVAQRESMFYFLPEVGTATYCALTSPAFRQIRRNDGVLSE